MPEIVVPVDEAGTLAIQYLKLLPVFVNAIQQLTQRLEALEEKK